MACQMADAQLRFTTAVITAGDAEFRAIRPADRVRRLLPGLRRRARRSGVRPRRPGVERSPDAGEGQARPARRSTRSATKTKPPAPLHGSDARPEDGSGRDRPPAVRTPASSGRFRTAGTSAKASNQLIPTLHGAGGQQAPREATSRTWSTTSSRPRWSSRSTTSRTGRSSSSPTSRTSSSVTTASRTR